MTASASPEKISVLIVEDETFTRTILSSAITSLGFQLVGAASNANDAMRLFITHHPMVVLLDLDLGNGPNGLDIANAMRRRDPLVGLALLSSMPDPRFLRPNLPELPPATLYQQKGKIEQGDELSRLVQDAFKLAREQNKSSTPIIETIESDTGFTDTQIELMRLVANGLSNAEIARQRFTTLKSTENSISRLAKKLSLDGDDANNQRVMIAKAYYRLVRGV